jgi:hypothetical protein
VAPTRDLRLLAGATFLSSAGDRLALIVLALQVDERGTDGAQLDVHGRSTASRGAIQPGGLCCPRPATQRLGEAGG